MSELVLPPSYEAPTPLYDAAPDLRCAASDEFGMPYPIHPYDPPSQRYATWTDDHHSFYQRRAEALQGDDGRAVRYSRCVTVARWLHNNFHKAFPDGLEELPVTPNDKFAVAVLAVAGYMPRQAYDVRDPANPGLVQLSKKNYEFVTGKRQMHFEAKHTHANGTYNDKNAARHIGTFFAQYIQKQDLSSLSQKDIRRFISAGDTERRRRLGMKILREAIAMAVEPVDPKYLQALDQGLVKRTEPNAASVVKLVFPEERWPLVFKPLERTLQKIA